VAYTGSHPFKGNYLLATATIVAATVIAAVAASAEEDDKNKDYPKARVTVKAISTHNFYSVPLLRSA
jgi:hypothetical protein